MNPTLELLKKSFNTNFYIFFTPHAITNLNNRFLHNEIKLLSYLIKAAILEKPINLWTDKDIVFIDEIKLFSLVCSLDKKQKIIIKTAIRGKQANSFFDSEIISVSISKQKSVEESKSINAFSPS